MKQSAIEIELYKRFSDLKFMIRSHDRGVIAGAFLSIIPILPVSIVGFLIGIFNYNLYLKQKLDIHELRFIKFSILAGFTSTILGIIIFIFLGHYFFEFIQNLIHKLQMIITMPFYLFRSDTYHGQYVLNSYLYNNIRLS